ncbi:unnamed protein product [Rotaria sordida]|uniref:Uncharacterized protein n=1 Tax=Rotaria sordida TaxID=392033 RepID=A0A820A4H4_9BILA|nr:unnamed protein product [Rotaria sordida]
MKTLWGDYYFDEKTKRVCKGAQSKGQKPMFVQFILENLWSVYEAIIIRPDNEKLEKIATSIGATLTPRDIQHTDPSVPLHLIFNQWLPIASAVFDIVVVQVPNPKALNIEKIEQLMCNKSRRFDTLLSETQQLKQAFINCSSDDQEPVIIYVSKLFYVNKNALSQNRHKSLTAEDIAQERELIKQKVAEETTTTNEELTNETVENDDQSTTEKDVGDSIKTESNENMNENVFLAFARVYSERLKRGQKIFVLSPCHDPTLFVGKNLNEVSAHNISHHAHEFIVQDLYLMMGREFTLLDQVPAGNIVDSLVLKSATLSTNIFCPSFPGLQFEASPIVRVAIKPKDSSQMEQLRHGMHLLNQADPFVKCTLKDTSEYILSTAGEEHLQRCIDDLTKIYARIEINVSTPIIPFHETIIAPPKVDFLNESLANQQQQFESNKTIEERLPCLLGNGLVELSTPNGQCTFQIRAVELSDDIALLLKIHSKLLAVIEEAQGRDNRKVTVQLNDQTLDQIRQLRERLNEEFIAANGNIWNSNTVDEIWSFGPDKCGSNLLINPIPNSIYKQHATANGFLCADPVEGVAFVIERWTINKIVNNENNDEQQETSGINNTDSAATTATINPVDEIESLIETMGITTEESSTLYIQQKPHLVIDKSKVVIKHESFSDQIISTIREACRIAYYNRVPFVEIDDPNNLKVDFNRSKICYTTIFTDALSTCRGFLITGNIGEQPFVYLAHRSKTYEPPSFTPSSTLIELLEDLTDDMTMKIFNNPPPNTKKN